MKPLRRLPSLCAGVLLFVAVVSACSFKGQSDPKPPEQTIDGAFA